MFHAPIEGSQGRFRPPASSAHPSLIDHMPVSRPGPQHAVFLPSALPVPPHRAAARRWMLWAPLVLALGLLCQQAWAWPMLMGKPQPVSDAEQKRYGPQVQEVIEGQIDAFRSDDGERAFAYASPNIQRIFGSPDPFMQMVRQAYPVVYRPQSMKFRKLIRIDDAWFQPVEMSDRDGRLWLAVYRMQKTGARQAPTWRIDGCEITRREGVTA